MKIQYVCFMIDSIAYARAGLVGNPSDGYNGKTISLIVKNFAAKILIYQSPTLHIEPQESDSNHFKNIYDLKEIVTLTGYNGGIPIIKAAIKKFCDYCDENGIRLASKNFTLKYNSNIPRQVGLAGSSAIIIATLRGLMQFYDVEIPIERLPTIALEAEVKELSINAGLQDRVIQAYEGCVYMDFEKEFLDRNGYGKYERLPLNKLPQFYIAYKTNLSKVSGKVLNDIKTKYVQGDTNVINTLNDIAALAETGKEAIENGDFDLLGELINENFNNRRKIMAITDSNNELVETARSCGASASFTGSGGAIIGIYKDNEMLQKLVYSLRNIQARVIKPYII